MSEKMELKICLSVLLAALLRDCKGDDDDYNVVRKDGSFDFGYKTPDSYHYADANRNNVVRGEFGGRNPSTGTIDATEYTAGPRGFRPRGKNVHRKYNLNQNGPRPVGSPDDPYYDPYEDPSYNFSFRTRTYNRDEKANPAGTVTGNYNYLDDVGERHNVDYIAGKNIGFHVRTPYPDSNPRAIGPLYFNGRGKPYPRGRTSIQRGLDGSYRFVSAGPDQRRTETSDSSGHVRGSYTYLDDKGVQHSVHYIAGPETGYRVLKNVKGPHLPTLFPFGRPDIIPPDFYDYIGDDVFDTAASGHVKPPRPGGGSINKKPPPGGDKGSSGLGGGIDVDSNDFDQIGNDLGKPSVSGSGPSGPSDDSDDDFGDDLFGGGTGGSGGSKPNRPRPTPGQRPGDDGAYKPSGDDGSYKPGPDESGLGGGGPISRPRPRPTPGKPVDDYDDGSSDGDFGLFPSSSTRPRPPIIQISGAGGVAPGGSSGCEKCKGTVVTNVGDKLFSVPPGVSVRAHVQSIDLLPVVPEVPSPSEQFKADMNMKTEQLNSAASDIVQNTTESTSTVSAPSSTSPSSTSTDATTAAQSTTSTTTTTAEDDDDTEEPSIF